MDGREKHGIWDNSGGTNADSAWVVKKEGLVRASIEGESWADRSTVKTLYECDGHQYVSSQWIGLVRPQMAMIPKELIKIDPNSGQPIDLKLVPRICALVFITRTERITVLADGSKHTEALTVEDQKFKLHEHRV